MCFPIAISGKHSSFENQLSSERTLERHRIAGTGPKFVRLGRRIVYRRADLEAWADENTFCSTSEVRS